MVVSSVSPERWDTIAVYPARLAIWMASRVSVRVPIWLTLMRMEFATFCSMPVDRRVTLVTNRSSPTSCTLSPIALVSMAQPSQSVSAMPSSRDTMG